MSTLSPVDNPPNPSTPAYLDDELFVETYLAIHKMSSASYRYVYLLWFVFIFFSLIFALLHWTGSRQGVVGAWWSKWSLRRRTFREKSSLEAAKKDARVHKQPFSFPSNAQLLSIALITIAALLVSFVGPDYIFPGAKLWQFHLTSRALPPMTSSPESRGLTAFGPPGYTISKAWWTAGGRTGITAFALLPLVMLFALKSPPFALLSLSFFLQLGSDKLRRLHRWTGLLVWFITTIHVVTWGVQLGRDRRGGPANKVMWVYVWDYTKFIYGVTSYFCLTLLILSSLNPIRASFYEAFYFLHVILVPLTLVTAGLHFPPISWWCWASLGVWVAERMWRVCRFSWINGIFMKPTKVPESHPAHVEEDGLHVESWEMTPTRPRSGDQPDSPHSTASPPMSPTGLLQKRAMKSRGSRLKFPALKRIETNHQPMSSISSTYSDTFDVGMYSEPSAEPLTNRSPTLVSKTSHFDENLEQVLAGHAYAVMLPGRTIRLHVVPSRSFTWAPGQYVLLRIPSVSQWTTHPFTIASVYDEEGGPGHKRPVLVLLVRAKSGFTRELWNEVSALTRAKLSGHPSQDHAPGRGVVMKAQVEGPFGSSNRVRWGDYSTVVIMTGGSGVSFGLSILEYLCCCMTGRDGKSLGSNPGGLRHRKFSTTRVRFVWLVREFAHIQWCASILRHCVEMSSHTALRVDIYVSNSGLVKRDQTSSRLASFYSDPFEQTLRPPVPVFANGSRRQSLDSVSAESDDDISDSFTDTASLHSSAADSESHPLDLTNFDGDDDSRLPGEATLSYNVKREGKKRRTQSRHFKAGQLPGLSTKPNAPGPSPQGGKFDRHTPPSSPLSETSWLSRGLANPLHDAESARSLLTSETELPVQVLEMDPEEASAMKFVSELAQSGRPRLARILADETEKARGPVAVACCGPTSLNALVRRIVANQVNPGRIAKGDMRGSVSLFSEEFES
ncbi:hypothetical protein SISSUDRAFT_1058911 [Sistotremastrum suecicum HHB10207 ss-3]|uniref:ferric-chelate reductase (NADPH) n=1 Tax=Sistotremastrum suecicum HHB10207 ss-3 TaxID=1314776 RepID=A0A166GV17_9AGAM|nr:hypothetical protein SISSUDRAFT_1058911 [Sistotremastrum suecicum HHB10207 ss-3]